MLYTEQELTALKASKNILELFREKGFHLTKRGRNFITLCPFHQDKDPSLIITPEKNLWHCLGCGAGGSVIDFIMKHENLSFLAAAAQLKKESPINVTLIKKIPPKRIPRAKLLERVVSFYERAFKEDKRGKEYLQKRGIKNPAIYETFRIGFCNGTLHKSLPKEGEIIENLKHLGILQEGMRESFESCVVFPLLNETGVIVSLYARRITETSIKHLYLTGPRAGLFNGQILKSYPEIILTESIIDSLSLYQSGIKNTIPCYGVNGFTNYHQEQIKNNKTQDIIIIFDNDVTGKEHALQIKQEIQNQVLSCEIKDLPGEKDINDYLIKYGEESLHSFLAAKNKTENKVVKPLPQKNGLAVQFCERKYLVKSIEGGVSKLRVNIKAENCTRFHIDTFDLYSAKARKSFIRDAALLFKEEQDIIENDILSLIGSIEQHLKNKTDNTLQNEIMTEEERGEALRFGKSKDLIEKILKETEALGYLGEEKNKLLCYLAMTSRKMYDPISVMILSASSAGKSALQDTVLSLCPEEDLMKFTSITERALFYKESKSLQHKVMALAEEAGGEDAGYAIRNLISSKELTIEATVKDPMTGKMTTMSNTVKGPTSVFKTTTNVRTDAETRSRFMLLTVDESREQTQRILSYQREMQTWEGFIQSQKRKAIKKKHRNFQRLLRPVTVFNPFARLLTYQDKKLRVRRDHPKYLQIISTIAFLHQLQRPLMRKQSLEYIEVTLEDIALANELAGDILSKSLDELSSSGRRLLQVIEEIVDEKKKSNMEAHLTRREIREASGWGETYVRAILNELVRMDYLMPVRGGYGKSFYYELLRKREESGKDFLLNSLTNVEELKEKAKKLGLMI